MFWTDTHCHLDAPEFGGDATPWVLRARAAGVSRMVVPAVELANFESVRSLAEGHGLAYALGIHPLYVDRATDEQLAQVAPAVEAVLGDTRLVAVGEIGLDHFVPDSDHARQERFFTAQLQLARRLELPVVLHVRRSVDSVLKLLRRTPVVGGIAHAFNGSDQQARALIDLGFKLGFGGAMTFDRALQLRRLARELPLDALVLETDAPDIPPHWLYRRAYQRRDGADPPMPNEPAQLPRIAETLAALRGLTLAQLADATNRNARVALPRLAACPAA